MERKTVLSSDAPAPVGPYVQAVEAGGMVFFSGQIALDPRSGAMSAGSAPEQTRLALDNLEAVVRAAGLSLGHIVKTTVFITDMGQFPVINEVYAEYFGDHPPARSCVEVAALPKGAAVEIEAIAVR